MKALLETRDILDTPETETPTVKESELPANATEKVTPNDWFKKKFPLLAEITWRTRFFEVQTNQTDHDR